MSSVRLLDILKTVKNPGNFAVGGVLNLNKFCRPSRPVVDVHSFLEYNSMKPRIEIERGRFEPPISMSTACSPTFEQEVKAVVEKSSQAPYGRGEETIVDTSVRKTWQLNPSQFTVNSCSYLPTWKDVLSALVKEVSVDLGFSASQDVSCELYKLLLYEPGGFFKPHRDTEKVDGMFGTLVIQLPSEYKGGQLVVHHQGEKKTFDFSDNKSEYFYAAFYADCRHEIYEVTEGYRLCLIYNLVSRAAQTVPPAIPSEDSNIETVTVQVVKFINEWIEDEKGPSVMAYLLDHKYCNYSLSFSSLKNRDRAVAEVLINARKHIDFDLYLTIVTKKEEWHSDDHQLISVFEFPDDYVKCIEFELQDTWFEPNDQDLVTPNGERKQQKLLTHSILDEILPKQYYKVDDEEFEPTGNEGAHVEKTYKHAILILTKSGKN